MHWLKLFDTGCRTKFRERLSAHTTLGIGGPADAWVEPNDFRELKELVCRCTQEALPYLIIGRGSNILAGDNGFQAIVICLNSPAFTKIQVKGNCLSSGAGAPLNKLINQSKIWGLGGLEFLAGIPASTAGALVMNAGNRNRSISRVVQSATVMDKKGKIRVLKAGQLEFGYRQSNLNKYIVLEATFKLVKRAPGVIQKNITAVLKQKRKTQDLISKSAGCIFKNPNHRLTAGEMIAACGLKQRRKADAEISGKHANYIINRNSAKSRDVLYLMDLAQQVVRKKFGVLLEPEIKILGE